MKLKMIKNEGAKNKKKVRWADENDKMDIDANELEGDDELTKRVGMEIAGETVFRRRMLI